MRPVALFIAIAVLLAGCGTFKTPVAVETSKGETLRGEAITTTQSGTFQVTNGAKLQCTGSYDPGSMADVMIVSVKCNDGRHGTANVQPDRMRTSGIGQGKFNDGSTFEVEFGDYAAAQ